MSITIFTKLNSDEFRKGLSSMESYAGITVKGITAAFAGIGKVVSDSISGYSNYQQLTGGIETLFKESQDTILEYANEAYKTSGLSANEYMNTITSFSASLINSLGGDTAAAAEKGNMAITDMADNANKLGTSVESIQNAYQGFSKGQFQLLDNLKLGYGGTKSEMERLLETADELNAKQGVYTEYSIDNYADIVDAIHVVQVEMGISGITAEEAAAAVASGAMTEQEAFEAMGTTAKEASITLEGSFNAAKAAWDNLIVGLSDNTADVDQLVDKFVDATLTAADNVIPVFETAVMGVGDLIQGLVPQIVEELPGVINEVAPDLADAGFQTLMSLINGISDNLDSVLDTAIVVLDILLQGLSENAEGITNASIKIVTTLITGLINALPMVVDAGVDICNGIASGIINYDWQSVAEQTLYSIADALDSAQKHVQILLDNIFTGGSVYGGDISNVDSTDFVNNMRDGIEIVGDAVGESSKWLAEQYNTGREILDGSKSEYSDTLDTSDLEKTIEEATAKLNTTTQKTTTSFVNTTKSNTTKQKSALVQAMDDLERQYKLRELTEKEYNDRRLEYLQKNENKTNDEWVKYYDQVQTYYEKLAETEKKAAEEAIEENEKAKDALIESEMNKLEQMYKRREITEEEYNARRLEYLNTHQDKEREVWVKYYDQVQSYYETLTETEQKAAEASAQETEKTFTDILNKYEQNISEFEKLTESLAGKLGTDISDIYEFVTDENGKIIAVKQKEGFKDLNLQISEYDRQLNAFMNRNVAPELIGQLASVSKDEGLALLQYWNALTDEQLWRLQGEIYSINANAADVAEKIYSDKAKEAADDMIKSFKTAIEQSDDSFKSIGQTILDGIIEGLNNGKFSIEETAERLSSAFDDYFSGENDGLIGSLMSEGVSGANFDYNQPVTALTSDYGSINSSATNNGGAVTNQTTQNIYVQSVAQTPDEIARAVRVNSQYGLAGAR